jgi:hypothetical protein
MQNTWLAILLLVSAGPLAAADDAPDLLHDVLPLLKTHCVKCHGPAKSEGGLNLSTPGTLVHGGENGATIASGDPSASLLWQRVAADEMPPEQPLQAKEKAILEKWIAAGAKGLPTEANDHPSGGHWAFVPLARPEPPAVASPQSANDVDRFLLAELEKHGLTFRPEADRATLIRRVAFDLTGLPPTLEEIATFQQDTAPDAYSRMVDRYLASPHYGERWGKYWLDAAGYADSNGYFNADSDRPLAYRYRDYVVRALNQDKPFDQFVIEQLAGDELAGYKAGQPATSEVISLLEATHYLRNGQDGTGESDGNDNEVTIDRYSALDSCLQIVSSSLLGLTVQCAKCHDHKFEPLSQRDYYQWQSVFYPAFNVKNWAKPNDRIVRAPLPGELESWQAHEQEIDAKAAGLREEFVRWAKDKQPQGAELFRDEFPAGGTPLANLWSNAAPGDNQPAGQPPINLDSETRPGTIAREGSLVVLESGEAGDRVLSTKQVFQWAPATAGAWIQVTFDVVDVKVGDSKVCERIAYYLAVRDFNDTREGETGNVLLEGKPSGGGAGLYLDYPGLDHKDNGSIGEAVYAGGHNYGVRVTRLADGKCRLDHLYDGVPEGPSATLDPETLGSGGFGFGLCCGRSFIVDNVVIAESQNGNLAADEQVQAEIGKKRDELAGAIKKLDAERTPEPGRIAWTTDRSAEPPTVNLLERGSHHSLGEAVEPAPLAALADPNAAWQVTRPESGAETTGRRLAWARWVTDADGRPGALLARVQANRIWQQHFGVGIVATCENLGVSGAAPSHPQLLEYLATEFVRGGWSVKHLHRLVLNSAAYRQASSFDEAAIKIDPDNRLLWRWTVRRLDAEAIRDAMLATAGQLDGSLGGPYIPTSRDGAGEVVVNGSKGANRRSLYLQQRRTQTLSLLGVFDSPSLVVNCVQRPVSTIPLQSLSLLNSPFLREQAEHFAGRLAREAGDDCTAKRLERSFLLAYGRVPTEAERAAAEEFLHTQRQAYGDDDKRDELAWTDYCQMLLASSGFLYVE